MPKKQLNEVCIQAACVAMGGRLELSVLFPVIFILFSINIASTLEVKTMARLDSIAIKGECFCGDERPVTPPLPQITKLTSDVVFLVDRSESITEGEHMTHKV